MTFNKLGFLGALVGVLFSSYAAAADLVPYYRFYRGYKKADVSDQDFVRIMNERFVPAAAATHQKNGLVAYMPAMLPNVSVRLQDALPDEVAIVAYESKEVYDLAKATPEGQVYAEMHNELFTPTSKSLVPLPMTSDTTELVADTAYDMINLPIDWQRGVTTFYFGVRKSHVSTEDFKAALYDHVHLVTEKMQRRGLNGYLVLVADDYEIAFMHWSSQEAMDAAFATADGALVGADAAKIMDTQMWKAAAPAIFNGGMQQGDLINFKFTPRN